MDKRLFSTVLMATVALLPVIATPLLSVEAASFNAVQSPRQIEYRVGLSPKQIWDGTIEYFKDRGFTTVVLIAADASPYQQELQKIKKMGMYPILDIERVIWKGKTSGPDPHLPQHVRYVATGWLDTRRLRGGTPRRS